ncbi:hypothetical protein SAMN05421780_102279 [Flexibacter flexilis DSM 6793]|uniref:Uncharacterized protein n=2 Tax=Flexibacter flexilis TaxID=998 RepID=A0A1I1FQA1_9BACT|nr:hypothetical protein SAMN05421780_102279 [Flexibacter flexilis DSM 6793]
MIGLLWLLLKLSRRGKLPPDGGDDGGGGFGDDNLPIIDLPPGAGLDEWLTDRIPETPTSTIKQKILEKN